MILEQPLNWEWEKEEWEYDATARGSGYNRYKDCGYGKVFPEMEL